MHLFGLHRIHTSHGLRAFCFFVSPCRSPTAFDCFRLLLRLVHVSPPYCRCIFTSPLCVLGAPPFDGLGVNFTEEIRAMFRTAGSQNNGDLVGAMLDQAKAVGKPVDLVRKRISCTLLFPPPCLQCRLTDCVLEPYLKRSCVKALPLNIHCYVTNILDSTRT